MRVRLTGEQRKFMKDTRKAMRIGTRKSNNQQLRRVHSQLIRPLRTEFKNLLPFDPTTTPYKQRQGPKSTQPYRHLKQGVTMGSVGRTGNGKGVQLHSDAFHMYFLASGTIPRRTASGANRGRIRPRLEFARWSKLRADQLLDRALRAYDETIVKPMSSAIKKEYRSRMIFSMPGIQQRIRL